MVGWGDGSGGDMADRDILGAYFWLKEPVRLVPVGVDARFNKDDEDDWTGRGGCEAR